MNDKILQKCKTDILKDKNDISNSQKLKRKINELENNRKKKYSRKLCEHNKEYRYCKKCNSASFCQHGRHTYRCKDCGTGLCEHKKRKDNCNECSDAYCEHEIKRTICKICKGTSICKHDKIKYRCRECDGSQYCEHDILRQSCKTCHGNMICIHDKHKGNCKQCHGSKICEHNIQKTNCIKCHGSNICEHKTQKQICKICKGTQICEHGERKFICRICDPPLHPNNWCQLCKHVNITRSNYKPYCFNCYCVQNPDAKIKYQYKLKEHHLRDTLKEYYPEVKMVFDKRIDEGCSLRRPDVRIECLTHTLIIECDENKHNGYSCENKRTMEIFQDLGNRPIVFLRFNPDSYKDKEDNTIQGCFKKTKTIDQSLQTNEWQRRIKLLKERIDHHIKNIPTKEVTVEQLFYQ